jgi:hypothetical protein
MPMFRHNSHEERAAKRAYVARGNRIKAGTETGLLESNKKTIRPEVRALIDEALAKRRQKLGPTV